VAALGSCLEARARGGSWLVRIEDLDPPREMAGAADSILRSLVRLGFEWDEPVLYQSTRARFYEEALGELIGAGAAYRCSCSRSELRAGGAGALYPGTCRNGVGRRGVRTAIRVRTGTEPIEFQDRVRGYISQSLADEVGDFVVRRRDGPFAYQLAVVVDDAAQGITDVVRGADLLDCTPRQIHLQRLLGLPTPSYAHLPIVTTPTGEKLSKQTGAAPVTGRQPGAALQDALAFLGHAPPPELAGSGPAEIWCWAREHWHLAAVPA
jgi:glutamyl-Q tRNA(Asp) synthetase